MRQTNLIIILVVILAASACRSDETDKSNSTPGSSPPANINNSNNASPEKATPAPEPPMPAMSLLSEFQKDQDAANKKYKKNWVVVTGPVWLVEKTDEGFPTVYFQKPGADPNKKIEWVICQFGREQASAVQALKKGDQVTLRGNVASYEMGTVWIRQCTIQ